MENTQIIQNKSFWEYLFGTTNYNLFWVCMIIAIICASIKMYSEVKKGKKCNPLSPDRFSVNYWILDGNLWRVIIGFFQMFICIRFADWIISNSFMKDFNAINSDEARLITSAFIGFGSDALLNKLRQWGWFGSAEPKKESINNQ